jgi:hypothetical protein
MRSVVDKKLRYVAYICQLHGVTFHKYVTLIRSHEPLSHTWTVFCSLLLTAVQYCSVRQEMVNGFNCASVKNKLPGTLEVADNFDTPFNTADSCRWV